MSYYFGTQPVKSFHPSDFIVKEAVKEEAEEVKEPVIKDEVIEEKTIKETEADKKPEEDQIK